MHPMAARFDSPVADPKLHTLTASFTTQRCREWPTQAAMPQPDNALPCLPPHPSTLYDAQKQSIHDKHHTTDLIIACTETQP